MRKAVLVLVIVGSSAAGVPLGVSGATPSPLSPKVGKTRPLGFSSYAVANAIAGGCYGPIGIYASIDATAPSQLSSARVNQIARASRPKRARIRIGGAWYKLVLDRRTSGVAYHRVWWTFKRVKVTTATAKKLVGDTATVSYTVGSKTYRTKPGKARDGSCE